jgi:hypothetical protein
MWQGERFGWGAYIPAEGRHPASGPTPLEAIERYLDQPVRATWLHNLSDELQSELTQASRYVCDCCGCRTLLNPGSYEICGVCGWEDDRSDVWRREDGPDAPSGPNQISLTEGRANYARFGASNERSQPFVRPPRPDELPSER